MFAARHQLSNLTVIVDANRLCATGVLADCVSMEPLVDKWRAFGWEADEVDGHDIPALMEMFTNLRERGRSPGAPRAVIARTVKGKGASFMENQVGWHHKVPAGELLEQARNELGS